MKQGIFRILENRRIAKDTYEMALSGDTSAITAPGQFVNIKLDGFFLRRPISVHDLEGDTLTLIYKTVGHGTEKMAEMKAGTPLDLLTGLGNGYALERSGDAPLLVGGGVGVPPLYLLARRLQEAGKHPTAVLGFNTKEEVFCEEKFSALGVKTIVTTADGSHGVRGFVTDALPGLVYSYFYSCGPEVMFRAMEKVITGSGEYSFEERMGCGFGACMGCSCKTLAGNKRICKEGPVMRREEILWNA